MTTTTDLRLYGLQHLVELLQVHRVSSGGIILPDSWWASDNYNTALILQSGPGLELDNGEHLPPVAAPGDIVLFEVCDFSPLDERTGFVKDTYIAGWLLCDAEDAARDRVLPANDFVLIAHDQAPAECGKIVLSDSHTPRPRAGVVHDVGPGRLLQTGRYRGSRQSVESVCGREVAGSRVWWEKTADALLVGRTKQMWTLVRAADLVCLGEA